MTRSKRRRSEASLSLTSAVSMTSSAALRDKMPESSKSMAPEGLPVLCLTEGSAATWSYGDSGQDGALRLISVEKLLSATSPPSIDLYEWRDLKSWPRGGTYVAEAPICPAGMPSYAAISHIWELTPAVKRRSAAAKRPLMVDIGRDRLHEISWLGLVEAALAARNLKCDYLWLDLLCLNQRSSRDKKMQISNMFRIYCNTSAVIVMFGGVAAAHPIDEPSAWINRAWTLQEATSCSRTWGLVEWTHRGTFSPDGHIFEITRLESDVGVFKLSELVNLGPGQRFGSGSIRSGKLLSTEDGEKYDIDLPVDCLGQDGIAISALQLVMESRRRGQWEDQVEGGSGGSGGSGESPAEQSDSDGSGDNSSDDDDGNSVWEDIWEEEEEEGGEEDFQSESEDQMVDGETGTQDDSDNTDFRTTGAGTDLGFSEQSSIRVLHGAAWRSMWLRTSVRPQDMVFSMMHLLGVTIEVDYKRTLEELVYDIVDKAPTPAWLTIGYDIPVDPKSGLIPILPTFTPNSLPTYTVDGTLQLASNIVQNDNLCYKFDLVMLSSSVTDGHMACMCAMDVKSASTPTQSPNSNGFLESELSLSHAEYELSVRCRFRGRIGTAVAVVGKSISKSDDFWQPDSEQGQFVLFLGRDADQVWRKSGAGYLDIPATDRIERRHLRVGGGPGAEFQACDCGKEMRRQQKMQKRSAKDPKELLKEACMAQDENAIRRLLDMGVELNGNDQEASILEDACHSGNERIIQLLLDHGADPNFQREGGGCPLQSACWSGNASAVRVILKAGADANAGNEADGNALQIAVLADHIEIVRLLLQHGADVNAQGGSHGNSLTAAADRGLKEMVELLIANGANVNSPGREFLSSPLSTGLEDCDEPSSEDGHESVNYNWTPLQAAAAGGHHDVVRILLENGADVNAQTDRFGSALQAACQAGQVDVVRLLIDHGARVSDQGGLYGNALQAAAAGTSIPVMRLLIEKGADVNAAGGFHGSALLAAAARRGPERDSTDAMLFLIESGADIHYRGGPFGHVLAAAAHAYNYPGVQMLIEHGADVNARGGKFGSAIQAAAQVDDRHIIRLLKGKGASDSVQEKDSYEQVIRRLVRKGANVNEIGGRYGTVLQAVSCGEYDKSIELLSRYKNVQYVVDVTPAEQERVVQLLLKNGSQVNACGGYHGTALQAASCVGNIRVAKLLIKKGAKVNAMGGYHGTALQAASRHGHEPVVRLLLANGAQVNAQGGVYGNALLAAAFHSTRMAELLVRNGADVHGDEPQGRSLLHIAAATGNCDMMRRGVENGLDANRKDRQGRTILHHAAASGSLKAVKQAVGYCSSVTARDADGWTPLHWAAKRGDTRVVKALMDAGARNSVQTKQGWTPYRVAVLHKNLAAAVLLAEHQSLTQGALAIVVEDEQQQLAMGYRHEGVVCDGCQLVSQPPHSNLPPAEA